MSQKVISKLNSNARFTIPKVIRAEAHICPHDFVTVQATDDGAVVIKKVDLTAV